VSLGQSGQSWGRAAIDRVEQCDWLSNVQTVTPSRVIIAEEHKDVT